MRINTDANDRVTRVNALLDTKKFDETHRRALMTAPEGVFTAIERNIKTNQEEPATLEEALKLIPEKFQKKITDALAMAKANEDAEEVERKELEEEIVKENADLADSVKSMPIKALRALTGKKGDFRAAAPSSPKTNSLKLNEGDMRMPSIDNFGK